MTSSIENWCRASVVMASDGQVYQQSRDGWWYETGYTNPITPYDIPQPVRVLVDADNKTRLTDDEAEVLMLRIKAADPTSAIFGTENKVIAAAQRALDDHRQPGGAA